MPRILLVLLLLACAGQPLPPLDPPLNHFSILIGVARLQDDPRLASAPAQAARLLDRVGWLQRNSAALLRLDRRLAEELTAPQREFLRARVGEPDPNGFFADLEAALAVLRERGGPEAVRPAADAGGPPGGEDGVDCVLVAWGVPRMDLGAEQARRLGPLLARVQALAWEDEQSMRFLYHSLEPAQKSLLLRRARAWSGGRSQRELEEEFEGLLAEAERRLRSRL